MRLAVRMSDDVKTRRAAYDRRQRAWTFLVLGALLAWMSFIGVQADATVWQVVGFVGVAAGVAGVARGLVLFQRPRP